MTAENYKALALIQLISEISLILLYCVSIFPTAYYFLFIFVMPLAGLNLLLSIIKSDNTVLYTFLNVVMTILAFIPVIGWLAIFTGIFLSVKSSLVILEKVGYGLKNEKQIKAEQKTASKQNDDEENIQTVKVTKKIKDKGANNQNPVENL